MNAPLHQACPLLLLRCRACALNLTPPLHPSVCRIVVVGRSTCPFCIEVTRTLADLGIAFPYFLVDKASCWFTF